MCSVENIYDSLFPTDYESVFRKIMDKFASKSESEFWLEKSPIHSLYLDLIYKSYPDLKIISIKRDCFSVVKSHLGLQIKYDENRLNNSSYRLSSIKNAIKNYYHINKAIRKFANENKNNILQIRYEELIKDYDETITKILSFLSIKQKKKLNSNYKKNTSFGDKLKYKFFSFFENLYFNFYNIFYSIMPYFLISYRFRRRIWLRNKFSFFSNSKLPNCFIISMIYNHALKIFYNHQ